MSTRGRERDKECMQAFMRWYGGEFGCDCTLDRWPDEINQGRIDAVFFCDDGSCVYLEHTSIDEIELSVTGRKRARIVKEREASAHLAIFRKRFREAGHLPRTDKVVVLRIPAQVAMAGDSAISASALRRWYDEYSNRLPDDNRCYPTDLYPGPIPIASLPFDGMIYSSHSSSQLPGEVIITLRGVEETNLEEQFRYVLDTNIAKLSEFAWPSDPDPKLRLLAIQNDRIDRCFKSEYVRHMRAVASGRDMGGCDEIWAFEMQSDRIEILPTLLWRREVSDERRC